MIKVIHVKRYKYRDRTYTVTLPLCFPDGICVSSLVYGTQAISIPTHRTFVKIYAVIVYGSIVVPAIYHGFADSKRRLHMYYVQYENVEIRHGSIISDFVGAVLTDGFSKLLGVTLHGRDIVKGIYAEGITDYFDEFKLRLAAMNASSRNPYLSSISKEDILFDMTTMYAPIIRYARVLSDNNSSMREGDVETFSYDDNEQVPFNIFSSVIDEFACRDGRVQTALSKFIDHVVIDADRENTFIEQCARGYNMFTKSDTGEVVGDGMYYNDIMAIISANSKLIIGEHG